MPSKKRELAQQSDTRRPLISLNDLRRHTGTRIRRPVLIVCEGEKTEQIYFKALRSYFRLSTVEVVIYGEGADPLGVVKRAIELRRERKNDVRRKQRDVSLFEEVWCVFDREANNEPHTFAGALTLARSHDIQLAISNPCFEYWYLLHVVESDRAFYDATDLLNELRKIAVFAGYQKQVNVFPMIHQNTSDAHQRAQRLYERCVSRDSDPFPNPSTLVYKLVEGIIAMRTYEAK